MSRHARLLRVFLLFLLFYSRKQAISGEGNRDSEPSTLVPLFCAKKISISIKTAGTLGLDYFMPI